MDPCTSSEYDNLLNGETEPVFEEWNNESSIKNNDESDAIAPKKRGNFRPKTIETCEVCGIVLKYPSRIKEHMRTHTGEKPFGCDICGKRFSQKTPMINHFREHMGDLPCVCSFGCGKRFVNNARKNAHELRHLGMTRSGPPRPHLKPPRRVVCPPLVTDQSRNENLSNSAVANFIEPNVKSESKPTGINPENISQYGEEEEAVQPAMIQPPSEEVQRRIDEVIETVLAKCLAPPIENNEESHLEMKSSENTVQKRIYTSNRSVTVAQCTICGLMLKHPSKIAAHVRTHTGEKPYQCGECGLSLTKASSLMVHIRRKHTNYRPYGCDWECGMYFVSEACKREHEKTVHSGIKRYECLIEGCSNTFSRRSALMRHRKSYHPEVFTELFDDVRVSNEEAADIANQTVIEEVINGDDVLMFDSKEHMMLINEAMDEETFAQHIIDNTG